MKLFYLALGGFLGAISRFSIGEVLANRQPFPFSTLFINLMGCFVLGWFLTFAARKKVDPPFILFVGTGFLGSFTTFSTFSIETVQLFLRDQIWIGILYILLSLILGILFSYTGYLVGRGKEQRIVEGNRR